MDGVKISGMLGVQKATSTISLSNPIKRRYVSQVESQPTVKVIVTETKNEDSKPSLDKPRRPRKADLSKCIKDSLWVPEAAAATTGNGIVHMSNAQQVIFLGENNSAFDLTVRSSQDNSSLGRWIEEDSNTCETVYYVQCPECNKKLKQKSYRSHVRTHTGVKQFKCDLCDDRFTRKNDVMRHKRLIHEKPRDYQCNQCQKYFVSHDNLAVHIEKHKTEMKCRVCDHGFGKREYYENHIKYVHPDGGHQQDQDCLADESVDDPDLTRKTDQQTPVILKKTDQQPVILRKGDHHQTFSHQKDMKIIYLGETGVVDKLQQKPIINKPTPNNHAPIILDSVVKKDDPVQAVDDTGSMGQILKMPDGTFMIAGYKNDTTIEHKELPTEESPDAVQTLIDAVQELIQTHESCEATDNKKTSAEGGDKKSVQHAIAIASETGVEISEGVTLDVDGQTLSNVQCISDEDWNNLRREYPNAEFVVVADKQEI